MSAATVQPQADCTLAHYAAAKKLPLEFLERLGLSNCDLYGRTAVRIPYLDEQGREAAVRFRVELEKTAESDGRFRWRKKDKPIPYGLDRLAVAREKGYLVLVEGESDAHTLWLHGIPALGLPGASAWQEDWAEYLEGIALIFVVIEPDHGGEATRSWIARSGLRNRIRLVSLGVSKDPSALYLAGPADFLKAWKTAMDSATPWVEAETAEKYARTARAYCQCAELAGESDILSHFCEVLQELGVTGEDRVARLIYLCLVSRLLDRPVSLAVKGPSSAGKSYLVERVLRCFPASAYYARSAMSERALAYSTEPLSHRFLVLFEAAGMAGEIASYLMRSLLSEGQLRYETVEKTKDGMKPRLIERKGPTGLLVTTTAHHLHPENETRMLSAQVTDSADQTRDILLRAAQEDTAAVDLKPWHALQEWLEGAEHRVTIPYATALASATNPKAVRLRRDFPSILGLVRAHAILHQQSRARDDVGRIVATLEDYAAVYQLTADLISEGEGAAVRKTVRETVAVVTALTQRGICEPTIQAVADELRLDKSAAFRRVHAALEAGYLRNNEEGRGRPARLVIGEPLPGDTDVLPSPDSLRASGGCTVAVDPGGDGVCASLPELPPKPRELGLPAPVSGDTSESPRRGCGTPLSRNGCASGGEAA